MTQMAQDAVGPVRQIRLAGVGVAVAGLLAACSGRGAGVRFAAATTLSAPTVVGTAPMLAVSSPGGLASAWVSAPSGGTDGRLYVSVNQGAAHELRDALGPVEGHGESPPKLAFSPGGALDAIYVVVKDVPTSRFPLAALRFVRSVDGGATWSAPVTVTDDGDFGTHNFHALHVASDGTIYVSWLGGPSGQSASWIAHSTDGGATWSPRVRVDTGNACPCCRTALGTSADGIVYMAWRHVYPGNVRDVVVSRSIDHGVTWSEPVRVHADGWVFDGCPHAGPSLQVDSAGRLHVSWWTGKRGSAGVWYARSDDSGASFGPAVPIGVADFSRPAHVQLALGNTGIVAVAWDDGTVKTPRVVLRLSRDGGQTFSPMTVLSGAGRAAGFPVLAVSGSAITVAWSDVSAVTADSAAAAAAEMKMTDPKAHKGLTPIGSGDVLLRHGTIE